MVAGSHRIIAGDAYNLDVLSCPSTPLHGHTLVTYDHIRTTLQPVQLIELAIIELAIIELNHQEGLLHKNPPGDYRTHPLRNKIPNLHRMLLFGE